jgi:hypothetical protein
MFIRAWYNEDTYADFKTDGVSVLSRSLAKRKVGGAAVSMLLQTNSRIACKLLC